MNGIQYYRLKGRCSKEQVCKVTGLCRPLLDKLEEETEHLNSCKYYMALAQFFDVRVEELLADYDDDTIELGDQYVRPSCIDNRNCLEAWRLERNLKYEQVAELLGLSSREGGRQACKAKIPKLAHLQKITRSEGITIEAFLEKYNGWRETESAKAKM